MKTFENPFTVRFRQADMAGIVYFNEPLNIFHDTYEQWVTDRIGTPQNWFGNPEWAVPIKKIETEYMRPLLAFESYTAHLSVTAVGNSSFSLKTEIKKGTDLCVSVMSTHVFMSKKTFKAIPIPEEILKKFAL